MSSKSSEKESMYLLARDLLLFGFSAAASILLQKYSHSKSRNNLGFADTTNESKLQQALLSGTTLNAAENVCTVDEHNTPTLEGHARSEMRLNRLWHRATYIIVRHINTFDDTRTSKSKNKEEGDEVYLLVQRRSNIKDYCPGKLDPTPGGVVGFREEYEDNAEREMMEEMNIDVSADNSFGNSMRKLFTFPYEDDKVRVWGGMFEVTYKGPLSDLKMQPEEVSEILRLSIPQIRTMAEQNPDDWMPDGLHAIQLYLQYHRDHSLRRRLFKEYSSGDLERYKLRPKPRAIFFDCDDCLYFDGWKLANMLTSKIEEWCTARGLPEGEAYQLYKKHGTALRGLLAEGYMKHCDDAIDEYLRAVHDLPIRQVLERDEVLRKMILAMDASVPKYIFTASVRHHAERCLEALGIDDLFVDIIDVKACNLATKHSTEAFEAAMRIAGVDDPESCIFLDDSIKNIEKGREMGWRSILVGKVGRDCGKPITSEHAEHEIDRIHHLPSVLPELFD